ncbi:MAG: DNA polymerase I, partial [Planctomycetes bacterium]|nr:DNA polymerase I [Planctomycetota bacterium]
MPETLYLIDGHAQIYRAYYARFDHLNSPSGEPTRATHVFFQMLLNLIRDRRPDYLVMVMDVSDKTVFRRDIYPDYKANRDPPPEDMPVQIDRIVSILEAVGVPILRLAGFEADDIIATLAHRVAAGECGSDLHVHMVSKDKDLEQLLGPTASMFDPGKNEFITHENLLEKKGWTPHQALEVQSLAGDTVDNIPGVKGIGPKTAAKLIHKYGTAQAVIDHADELTPKQRENVLAFAPLLEITRQLLTLRKDVPIEFDLAQSRCGGFDWQAARPIMDELGFRRLTEQLPGNEATRQRGNEATIVDGGGATIQVDYRCINTAELLDEFVGDLSKTSAFAFDTETTSIKAIDAELVGMSFAWRTGQAYYIPVRCMRGGALPLELVRERLAPIFAETRRLKVGQNLKYDMLVMRNAGMPVAGPLFDTMIASFVLDATRRSHGMDGLVSSLLGHEMIPISDLIGKGRDQLRMDEVPLEHV